MSKMSGIFGGGNQSSGPTYEEYRGHTILSGSSSERARIDKLIEDQERVEADRLAAEQADEAKKRARAAQGRGPGGTLLTGGMGATDAPELGKRTILGSQVA